MSDDGNKSQKKEEKTELYLFVGIWLSFREREFWKNKRKIGLSVVWKDKICIVLIKFNYVKDIESGINWF